MANNFYTNIIGKGILFPLQLQTNSKGETGIYPINGDFELIRNNISALMYYMIGFRIRQETFGTRLWECIEEPNTQVLAHVIEQFLVNALTTWEDRITVQKVDVSRADTKVNILVTYQINNIPTSQYVAITYDLNNNNL